MNETIHSSVPVCCAPSHLSASYIRKHVIGVLLIVSAATLAGFVYGDLWDYRTYAESERAVEPSEIVINLEGVQHTIKFEPATQTANVLQGMFAMVGAVAGFMISVSLFAIIEAFFHYRHMRKSLADVRLKLQTLVPTHA